MPRPRRAHLSDLTDREREIVTLIAEGLANKEIALRLKISQKTVETHRTKAIKRLGFFGPSTALLTRHAIRSGWLEA